MNLVKMKSTKAKKEFKGVTVVTILTLVSKEGNITIYHLHPLTTILTLLESMEDIMVSNISSPNIF